MEEKEKKSRSGAFAKFAKVVVFLLILVLLLNRTGTILYGQKGEDSACGTGMDYVRKYKNQYDVIACGTSISIMNINHQHLYEEYGISGVSIGEAGQPIYLTYYTLKEALKYQKPKAVIFAASNLFYSQEYVQMLIDISEYTYIHYSIDAIKSPFIKYEAVKDTEKLYIDVDLWSYLSKLYQAHSNWEKLSQEDFEEVDIMKCMNGNVSLYGTAEGYKNPEVISDYSSYEAAPIDETNEYYLSQMIQLCKENDVDFVMAKMVSYFKPEEIKALQEVCEKYDITYLDTPEEEMGFVRDYDTNDELHYNLSGAIKVSDYIGTWLQGEYELEDHRGDKDYQFFEDQRDVFAKQKDTINLKIDLMESIDLNEYLTTLAQANNEDNLVLISKYGETGAISAQTQELLHQLGLETDITGKEKYSYAAAIGPDYKNEVLGDGAEVKVEDKIGKDTFVVRSHATDKNIVSLNVKGTEFMQKGKGLNVVVFNLATNQLVSSVYFDTTTEENPPQSRSKAISGYSYQKEVDTNIWEAHNNSNSQK